MAYPKDFRKINNELAEYKGILIKCTTHWQKKYGDNMSTDGLQAVKTYHVKEVRFDDLKRAMSYIEGLSNG